MRRLRLALLALVLASAPVLAQNAGWPPPAGAQAALGVYNTAAPTMTNGQVGYLQIDSSGRLITAATITTSGTQNVNLTQILGAAPSLTNPLWVFPAIGATFPVSIAGTVATSSGASATGGATFAHVAAGQATTVIKGSAGTLYSLCLNSAATATNTTNVYDNPTTSGTVIATVAATTATVPTCLQYGPAGIAFANGLTIITATANGADMTVSFK